MLSSRELRDVMGDFPTGVTIVTTIGQHGEPVGFTANPVTAVSLEPPLVLVCVARDRQSHEAMLCAERFAINILSQDQEDLARRFARSGQGKFDGLELRASSKGLPILPAAIGVLRCRREGVYEAGDHSIVTGLVEAAQRSSGSPLVFFRGAMFGLGRDEGPLKQAS